MSCLQDQLLVMCLVLTASCTGTADDTCMDGKRLDPSAEYRLSLELTSLLGPRPICRPNTYEEPVDSHVGGMTAITAQKVYGHFDTKSF